MSEFTAVDHAMMARALRLAERGAYTTKPNPMVGCVIARGAEVVGEGWHERKGGPHAEIVALQAAGARAKGATAYVTLEPCAHTGRTGPCTQRILDAGVARVVYGVEDPNPVAAGGAELLRDGGVDVRRDDGLRSLSERGPLRAWLHRQRTGRPFVTWKYAASLDGFVAASDGTSQWITGPEARSFAHGIRERLDAIVVGSGTVAADDPSLSARNPDGSPRPRSPLACVMGESAVPAGAAVRSSPGGFAHLATRDPARALEMIDQRLGGALHVLIEGGPTVAGAFLAAGLVDEIDAYIAPIVLGGGRRITEGFDVGTLAAAARFAPVRTIRMNPDIYIRMRTQDSTHADCAHPVCTHPLCTHDSEGID